MRAGKGWSLYQQIGLRNCGTQRDHVTLGSHQETVKASLLEVSWAKKPAQKKRNDG